MIRLHSSFEADRARVSFASGRDRERPVKLRAPRRVLQCQFIAREFFRPGEAGPEIPERFTLAARYLFGP
jgi:hypothetical protein